MRNNLENKKKEKNDKFNTEFGGKGKYINLIGTARVQTTMYIPTRLRMYDTKQKERASFSEFYCLKQRHYIASKLQQYKI